MPGARAHRPPRRAAVAHLCRSHRCRRARRGQVVHVDLPPIAYDGAGLARALNRQLAPEVVVRRAEEVDDDFDARRSATEPDFTATSCGTPRTRPFAGPHCVARDATRSTSSPCAPPPTCCSGTPRLPLLLPTRRRAPTPPSPSCAGYHGPLARGPGPEAADAGAARDPGCCVSRSRPAPSATKWCARSWASLIEVGRGRETARDSMERLRAASHLCPNRRRPKGCAWCRSSTA